MSITRTLTVDGFIPWLESRGFTLTEAVQFYDALEAADGESGGERPRFSRWHDGIHYTAKFVWNDVGAADVKVTTW